ncbi:hypothetical protein PF001_g3002 [Phytophthora fragariae]|uniref:Uncharacterized protein n=1 Tax=Phytophthora fragariae TaxID=53985 RepID=A0A6A3FYT2_9STRA|nr:hypothetical protein PF009_g3506 [Phytophthora fragariae]KAE9152981.1 hypothetical protein PF006_g2831 [Phytophthora fragariae]KAE9325304.1 hypothetical protein PF001_g3002 [Phytophthora fragariae]
MLSSRVSKSTKLTVRSSLLKNSQLCRPSILVEVQNPQLEAQSADHFDLLQFFLVQQDFLQRREDAHCAPPACANDELVARIHNN